MITSKLRMELVLKDKRKLFFSEFGEPNGKPLIYLHGFPSSRLEVQQFDEIATKHNYRLIALDRPGMGLSTINPDRTILSTVDDIVALADYLKIDKFGVIGYSGGCPYALACAYKIPDRLTSVTIISGLAQFDNVLSHKGMLRGQIICAKLVNYFPSLAVVMMLITRALLKKSDKLLEKMIKPLPEVDKQMFRDDVIRQQLIGSALEAFRNGVLGPAHDMQLVLKPWGFNLPDIKIPVSIWHGSKDTQVPVSGAKLNASLIPNAKLKIFENEGHHSLIKNHFEDIILSLK